MGCLSGECRDRLPEVPPRFVNQHPPRDLVPCPMHVQLAGLEGTPGRARHRSISRGNPAGSGHFHRPMAQEFSRRRPRAHPGAASAECASRSEVARRTARSHHIAPRLEGRAVRDRQLSAGGHLAGHVPANRSPTLKCPYDVCYPSAPAGSAHLGLQDETWRPLLPSTPPQGNIGELTLIFWSSPA